LSSMRMGDRDGKDGPPKSELVLTDEERVTLERLVSRRKSAQALAMRARIVLRCAAGLNNRQVAQELGVSDGMVGKWRRRFVAGRAVVRGADDQEDPPRHPH